MAGIQINDGASIMTEVTTIFQDNQDERYVNLQADRKAISIAMNKFVKERWALTAKTQEDRDADFEIEGREMESNQARVYLAMNTTAWVQGAHSTLDPYNQYDKAMLGKMADYVEGKLLLLDRHPSSRLQMTPTERPSS